MNSLGGRAHSHLLGSPRQRFGNRTVFWLGIFLVLTGKLFELLSEIYDPRSYNECDIDIAFNHSASGAQQNPALYRSRSRVCGRSDSRAGAAHRRETGGS